MLCRKEVLSAVLEHRFGLQSFQCFIGASAAALGLQIIEIDTSFDDRRSGHSFSRQDAIGAVHQNCVGNLEVSGRDAHPHSF